MNFCEVNILFAFIDIKQLRMRPTKKPGHGHITYNSGSYHVILPCSFYLSSQFSQPLTSNHLNALQIFFFFLTLQYCIGFAKYRNESTTGIHVFPLLPPPSPYHPSGSSQCTSPKHPVSCINPGLATCSIYDIIRISMPFSQIFPPSLPQSP